MGLASPSVTRSAHDGTTVGGADGRVLGLFDQYRMQGSTEKRRLGWQC